MLEHYTPNSSVQECLKNEFFSLLSLKDFSQLISQDYFYFKEWLDKKNHGQMFFLEKNSEVRVNPNLILNGTKSALVFIFPYFSGKKTRSNRLFENKKEEVNLNIKENSLIHKKLISKYVYSKDYHKKIHHRLNTLAELLKEKLKIDFQYRSITDSVPFFDRAIAKKSGLGFIGKNTMLIRPGLGSYFFIGTLLTSLPATAFGDLNNKKNPLELLDCGTCNKCIEACPTQAFNKEYELNANKCLSYLSIEHRDTVENKFLPYFKETIYGCDICQNVCPYNLFTVDIAKVNLFKSYHKAFTNITVEQIALMTKAEYSEWFGGTSATRAKYPGLVRNALYHLYAVCHKDLKNVLKKVAHPEDSLIQNTIQQILLLIGE